MTRSKIQIQRITSSDGQTIVGVKGVANISSDDSDDTRTISQQTVFTQSFSAGNDSSVFSYSYSISVNRSEGKEENSKNNKDEQE